MKLRSFEEHLLLFLEAMVVVVTLRGLGRQIGTIMGITALVSAHHGPFLELEPPMKDFPNASFSPDLINAMKQALDGALDALPHPVNSDHVQSIAENILRGAEEGERNPVTLQIMALVEFQIRSDET